MDFRDSPQEARFRGDLRAWLASRRPDHRELPADSDEYDAYLQDWHQQVYDAGWIGSVIATAYGGLGLGDSYEAIFNDELAASGCPPVLPVNHLARALAIMGREDQKTAWIKGILSGRTRWCQGFSEPAAGSDLAALRATGVEDGDDFVINGHKVWTSHGPWSQWAMVLVRTDPDLPRHRAISTFAVRMDDPGVSTRPIVQITGSHEFSESVFQDVRVPASNMIGERGSGWTLAMTAIGFERGPADVGWIAKYQNSLRELKGLAREHSLRSDGALGHSLARACVEVEMLRRHVQRSLAARPSGRSPGPAGSVDKLLMVRTEQALYRAAIDLLGEGVLLGRETAWLHDYFYSRASSIMGGTQEIQKNIIAQRLLGLPR
jgi:alkylation response protein AidB-like acyl-CoA dehydrogenase